MCRHAWPHPIEATNQYLLLYGPLLTPKNSNSHLNLFVVERILYSDWPWDFRIITQEPDFSKTFCFLQKVKRLLTLSCSTKKSYIFELIIFSLKSEKPHIGTVWALSKTRMCHFCYFPMFHFMEKKSRKDVQLVFTRFRGMDF